MHGLRHLALALSATTLLTACTLGEAADAPEPSDAPPTSEPVAREEPTAAPEPVVAFAALASEPGAVAVAEVLAGRSAADPVVVEAVLSPDQRARLRGADEVVVVATSDRGGSRLAASVELTTSASVRRVADAETGLAEIVREAVDLDEPSPSSVRVATATDGEALLAIASGLPHGDLLVLTPQDPRAAGPGNDALRLALSEGWPVRTTEDVPDWKLDVVRAGLDAPGGGQLLGGKRFVAMYGTPGTSALGVLGEQSLDATIERIATIAAPYDDGTLTVVPTFEIIVDVASAGATEDGDYSYSIDDDLIREWVDRGATEGFQVVLDVQPGRTDFLTHAKALEEFLVQPHVGLALDPEWRLEPHQVHLRQIGSVTGTEVNTVVDWMAQLVRDHALPQKLLVLHQFKFSMITEFDVIRTPDELLVALHMDGQGSLGSKYGTYGSLFDAGVPQGLGMVAGWKNFYDEDSPMANASQVLALDPQPVFISFQ